jgi:hypothetical protein
MSAKRNAIYALVFGLLAVVFRELASHGVSLVLLR